MDIESYKKFIFNIPMLSAEEEIILFNNLQLNNDLNAAKKLILSHLRIVITIASDYKKYGLPLQDLIQEGTIGLMKAVKRFSLNKEARLSTFATYWIRGQITEYIIKNWRIVKIASTKNQIKLFFNLLRLPKKFEWLNKDEINLAAKRLNVKPKEIIQMEQRLSFRDVSFDPITSDDNHEKVNNAIVVQSVLIPVNYLTDEKSDPAYLIENDNEKDTLTEHLNTALDSLDARSYDIIQSRWLIEPKKNLKELAHKYNISLERIRQIEKKALQQLKNKINIMCYT